MVTTGGMVKIRFNNVSYLVEVLDITNDGSVVVRYEDGDEELIYPKDWERYLKTQSDFELELKHQ